MSIKMAHWSDEAAYYDKRTMKDSLKMSMSDGITAYVLPLAPIYPEGRDCKQLTDVLQQVMQDGLATLHAKVLKA